MQPGKYSDPQDRLWIDLQPHGILLMRNAITNRTDVYDWDFEEDKLTILNSILSNSEEEEETYHVIYTTGNFEEINSNGNIKHQYNHQYVLTPINVKNPKIPKILYGTPSGVKYIGKVRDI